MSEKLLVFLSSTSQMEAERTELKNKLPSCYELYRYEEDRPRRKSPKEHCRQMIEQSHAFVGVLGTKYGTTFPMDTEQKSIVEWEFDVAIRLRRLEVLAFIKNITPGEVLEPPQQAFIKRISDFGSGLWCKRFTTPGEFAEFVHLALQRLLIARYNELNARLGKQQSWATRILLAIAFLSVLVLVLIATTRLEQLFSTASIIGLSMVTALVVVLCGVLILRELRPKDGKPR